MVYYKNGRTDLPKRNDMTISNRTFGVETEFVGDRNKIVSLLNSNGISCKLEGYGHTTRPFWKMTTDSSIHDNSGNELEEEECGELVSPILSGGIGLEVLTKVHNVLANAGATVNRTCGLHVHVGVDDLSPNEILAIVKRYAKQEAKIDAFMPRSRRGNENHHCESVASMFHNEAKYTKSIDSFSEIEPFFSWARYVKLNVMSYARQKTIEFRHHSGSINSTKIVNWVQFCVNFVEQTVADFRAELAASVSSESASSPSRRRGRPAGARTAQNPFRAGSKKSQLVDILMQGRWNYLDDLACHLDTSTASVAAMISKLKAVYPDRIVRSGRADLAKFKMNPASGAVLLDRDLRSMQVPVGRVFDIFKVLDRDIFHGLPADINSFYQERTMELADAS